MNEFVEFATPNFHISSTSNEIQLWGTRSNYGDVDLVGVSIHWPDEWLEYNPDNTADDEDSIPPRSLRLECAISLAKKAGVPLFWVGDFNARWRDLSGTVEIGEIEIGTDGIKADTDMYEIEPETLPYGSSAMERRLQEIMGTSLTDHGTDKEKNQTLTPVQEWVRHSMPENYSVMDIDILVGDGTGNATGLVELRRSDWPTDNPIHSWWPWFNDRRQYYLLADAAEQAYIEPVLIQHSKKLLNSDSTVGYYKDIEHNIYSYETIEENYQWYTSEEKSREWLSFDDDYISASDAINRLANL